MLDMLIGLLSSAESLPVVAKVLVYVVIGVQVLSAVVTGIVAMAHGGLAVMKGVGIASKPMAEKEASLEAQEAKAEGFLNDKILPVLNRLSQIPLPKA